MIVSVQIAELGRRDGLGVLARPPRPERVPGLRHAETVFTAPIGPSPLPLPNVGRVGLIAAWEDDAACERFAAGPLAQRLAGGWQVRLEPLRVSGAWPEVPDLLAATGFGRLPRLVSTFTVWRSAAEMREYAHRAAGAHRAAIAADNAHPFHSSSAFIRLRPYFSEGIWGEGDPLAAASLPS